MRLLHRPRSLLTAAFLLLASGCSDATGPATDVAGNYEAISIIFTDDAGGVGDLYAGGARITISLTSAGTTTGALSFPGASGAISLAGTYVHDEAAGTVVFTQESETILREITWTVTGAQLRGSFVDPDGVLAIALARRP